jgi:hypothetical protein
MQGAVEVPSIANCCITSQVILQFCPSGESSVGQLRVQTQGLLLDQSGQ